MKGISEAARMAALSAGQAAVVAHVAAHELGAAAYAIRAAMESASKDQRGPSGRLNAFGSGRGFPMRSVRLCWMMSGFETTFAGAFLNKEAVK